MFLHARSSAQDYSTHSSSYEMFFCFSSFRAPVDHNAKKNAKTWFEENKILRLLSHVKMHLASPRVLVAHFVLCTLLLYLPVLVTNRNWPLDWLGAGISALIGLMCIWCIHLQMQEKQVVSHSNAMNRFDLLPFIFVFSESTSKKYVPVLLRSCLQ